MPKRTQILLENAQYAELKRRSRETGRSLSSLVRECVASYMAGLRKDPLLRAVGGVRAAEDRSDPDLAARHDAPLYGRRKR